MGVLYLTVDQVVEYHALALSVAPGVEGLRSYQALASSVFQAQQTFGEQDMYASIPEKAAAYAFFLTQNHPFVDANKRTAAISMLAFLEVNDYEFYQSDQEIEEMFVSLAASEVDQGEFFGWVCNHAKTRPPTFC